MHDPEATVHIPALLRKAAHAIENGDQEVEVLFDEHSREKLFLAVLMPRPKDDLTGL